jgi:holo-[acyl-carrier protein] synthase
MRYFGIGTDIIEIERIERAIKNPKFKERVYTAQELESLSQKGDKPQSYAGKFCAKEAVAKALGTGIRNFHLTDIEILNDSLGKPYVIFGENLKQYTDVLVDISISHSREYATAVAIIFEREV